MSDSGSTPPPSGPPKGPAGFPPSSLDTPARIENIEGALRANARPVRVEGEVVKQNRDGTVRVRTEQGDLTLRVRSRDIPTEGQRLEVDIPAGRPPRKATVRPAPEQQTRTERQAPPAQDADVRQTQSRGTERPTPPADRLSTETRSQPIDRPDLKISQPLQQNDRVRLIPLTQQQAAQISVDQTLTVRTAQIEQRAIINSATVQDAVVRELIQSLQPQQTTTATTQTVSVESPSQSLPITAPPTITTAITQNPYLQTSTAVTQQPAILSPTILDTAVTASVITNNTAVATTNIAAPVNVLPNAPALQTAALTPPQQTVNGTIVAAQTITTATSELVPGSFIQTNTLTLNTPQTTETAAKPFLDVRVNQISPQSVILSPVSATETTLNPAPQTLTAAAPTENASLPQIQSLFIPVTAENSGTNIQVKNIASPPNLITANNAAAITGTVVAKTATGLPVINIAETPLFQTTAIPQNYVLQFNADNLNIGNTVQLTPLNSAPSLAQGVAAAPTAFPPFIPMQFFATNTWPALEQLQQTLQQIAPQVSQAFAQTMPNPATPNRIPAAALFFLVAMKSGDLGNWMGDKAVDLIRRSGKNSLLQRLTGDLNGLNRTSSENVGQDWRALSIPLMWENEIQKMQLYYRRDKDSDDEADMEKATRFIFDLNLTKIGPLQIDGYHRAQTLNLVVRTHEAFSPNMRKTIQGRYIEALEQTGVTGDIIFQSNPDKWISIDMPHESMQQHA